MLNHVEAVTLFAQLEGNPCVFLEGTIGDWFDDLHIARLEQLHADERKLTGRFIWEEPLPPEERRYEGFSTVWAAAFLSPRFLVISDEQQYWLVFDPDAVDRTRKGDLNWIDPFIDSVRC